MSGPWSDPLEAFAAGLARGALSWTLETVKAYAQKLRERKQAFFGRRDYLEEVKARRASSEWRFYKGYLTDKSLITLAQMGLVLREWEDDPARHQDIQKLRNRIRGKFGDEGLRVSEVVQSRILSASIPTFVSTTVDPREAAQRIEAFLKNAHRLCLFVQESDSVERVAAGASKYLTETSTPVFIFFSRGSARTSAKRIAAIILKGNRSYRYLVQDIFGALIITLIRSDLSPRDSPTGLPVDWDPPRPAKRKSSKRS